MNIHRKIFFLNTVDSTKIKLISHVHLMNANFKKKLLFVNNFFYLNILHIVHIGKKTTNAELCTKVYCVYLKNFPLEIYMLTLFSYPLQIAITLFLLPYILYA